MKRRGKEKETNRMKAKKDQETRKATESQRVKAGNKKKREDSDRGIGRGRDKE